MGMMEAKRLMKLNAARQRYEQVLQQHPRLREIEERLIELHSDRVFHRSTVDRQEWQNELQQWQGLRSSYLQENSIPETFAEPDWDCPLCQDTGVVDGRPCSCEQRRWLEQRFQHAHLPARLREQTFGRFSLTWYSASKPTPVEVTERENAMNVLRACQTFVARVMEDIHSASGLFITGGTGLGKTFLCSAICLALSENGIVSLYSTYSDLLTGIKAGFDDANSHATPLAEMARQVPVLILDDLGAEYTTDFATSCLFDIINHRRNERLPLVVSSNLTLSDVAKRYDQRICSRLGEVCETLPLYGTDIRSQQR